MAESDLEVMIILWKTNHKYMMPINIVVIGYYQRLEVVLALNEIKSKTVIQITHNGKFPFKANERILLVDNIHSIIALLDPKQLFLVSSWS